jgi:hypothetical protein
MIIRLLITAMLLLGIAKFYLNDNKNTDNVDIKPKQQIEKAENKINEINQQAEDRRKKMLEELGI